MRVVIYYFLGFMKMNLSEFDNWLIFILTKNQGKKSGVFPASASSARFLLNPAGQSVSIFVNYMNQQFSVLHTEIQNRRTPDFHMYMNRRMEATQCFSFGFKEVGDCPGFSSRIFLSSFVYLL